MRTLLIDADSECFAAAAVAEHKRIVAMREDGALTGPYPNVKAVTESLGKENHATAVLFRSHEVLTEEAAIQLVDARLRRIVYQANEKYGEVKPELWLSGKLNYRHMVDPEYKGGRDSVAKPYWLARLKQHCMAHWRARMTRTWEADDEISIRARELGPDNYIVCSLDKDLRQIQGRHIVIGKGHLDMTATGSLLRLYVQILAGDNTDNIKGCYGQGQGDDYATAFAYLEPFVDGGERALWLAVVERYQRSIDKFGATKCGYIDARGAALHTAQLVYLLEHRPTGQIPPRWTPPEDTD